MNFVVIKEKVLSLIDVIREMLVKNSSNLENEVNNYYEDKKNSTFIYANNKKKNID